jgi:hypothetical protein
MTNDSTVDWQDTRIWYLATLFAFAGFYLGSRVTGELAVDTYMGQPPAWIGQAKTLQLVVLFGAMSCAVGLAYLDQRETDE